MMTRIAMGVHFGNAELIGDGTLEPQRPEPLAYEPKNGQLHLVAVERLVIAEAWDATHRTPPALLGRPVSLRRQPESLRLPGGLRAAPLGLEG
jgi:hypothetical protein